jgi:hypothetical protein
MKQFLLFAGTENAKTVGVNGLMGDFDSAADAFVAIVDNQLPAEWWHILDTKTGEVLERRHMRVHNGMISFQKSEWLVGNQPGKVAITAPGSKTPEVADLEAGMRAVVASGFRNGNGHANGHANGHSNGSAHEPAVA